MNAVSINQAEANELFTFAINNADVQREMVRPTIHSLGKHLRAGRYDEIRALRVWGLTVEMAARRYCATHGGHWRITFPDEVRSMVSVRLSDHYADHIDGYGLRREVTP